MHSRKRPAATLRSQVACTYSTTTSSFTFVTQGDLAPTAEYTSLGFRSNRTVYTTYMFYTYILLPTEYWDSINKYGPTQWQHTSVCRWSLTMTSWQLIPTMNPTPSPSVGPAWIQPAASHPNFVCFFRGGGHCYFSSSVLKPSVSQTFLLAEPFLLRKITTDPHILAYVNIHCPDDTHAKLKIYISELILDRYIPVSIPLKCIAWFELIRMTFVRFEGTGSFLIWYSNS